MINSLKCPFVEMAKLPNLMIKCNDLRHCYKDLGEDLLLKVINAYCRGDYESCPIYKCHCEENYPQKLQKGIDHRAHIRTPNSATLSVSDFQQIFPELL